MVWLKSRSGATDHALYDTARGATLDLASNTTAAQTIQTSGLTSFTSDGFRVDSLAKINGNGRYASWTFREQPRFFDIVTYTGNGTNRTIAHSLGVAPGLILIKRTNAVDGWSVYHRSLASTAYLELHNTNAAATSAIYWNSIQATSDNFSLGTSGSVNFNGGTYLAYVFAHDSLPTGLIQCGSYTGNGSATGPVVTLGWEPQWLLIKRTDSTGDWNLIDNMRGFVVGGTDSELNPNLSAAESTGIFVTPTATGFQLNTTDVGYNASGGTYIYMAIRRGPMRTPTTGASVFALQAYDGFASAPLAGPTESFVSSRPDLSVFANRGSGATFQFADLLRGYQQSDSAAMDTRTTPTLRTNSAAAETTTGNAIFILRANGMNPPEIRFSSGLAGAKIGYIFRRAPGFFDVVCYTGMGVARTVNHNLGVAPELIIGKSRTQPFNWGVYSAGVGNTAGLSLNTADAPTTGAFWWNNTNPTSSAFTLGTSGINVNGDNFVAYLFASCPDVSRVGSYIGTGATQTINCGFAAGARFVLIKRTDATGDWYVWDTARGIIAANDPHMHRRRGDDDRLGGSGGLGVRVVQRRRKPREQ